ncbi:hypothetical protein AAC03nite_28150 [Alicyclobacillus acidoterrestris]|nr:hypothetical protein AAC03nite_28150 [Alicyclobacillus acidoterrestris]
MALRVVTQPASEPITLDETKLYLRVDTDADDAMITALIVAAREYCQAYQNRAYITQTLELTMDHFPGHRHFVDVWYQGMYSAHRHQRHHNEIKLLMPPIQSVESISYTDHTGSTTTLDPSAYVVDIDSEPGRVVPAYGSPWPIVQLQPVNGVRVRYVAGYGGADAVPKSVKQAMQMLVAHWYENREAVIVSGYRPSVGAEIDFAVRALLSMERVIPT